MRLNHKQNPAARQGGAGEPPWRPTVGPTPGTPGTRTTGLRFFKELPMASYFISAHGALRKEGNRQTMNKFIVPTGTTIYMFVTARACMSSDSSDKMMNLLICPDFSYQDELYIRSLAIEVFTEGELCLNYTAYAFADNKKNFSDPCGLYMVGNFNEKKPKTEIPPGSSETLKSLIGGIGARDASMGNHFYWCCCREHDVDTRVVGPRNFYGVAVSGGAPIHRIWLPGETRAVNTFYSDPSATSNAVDACKTKEQYRRFLKALLDNVKGGGSLLYNKAGKNR
jgi:hypothetical protein